jgi:hypothetical protein
MNPGFGYIRAEGYAYEELLLYRKDSKFNLLTNVTSRWKLDKKDLLKDANTHIEKKD